MPSRPGKRKHHRHWQPLTRPGPGARAAVLVRYSPPERRGYTLETQRRMCQEHDDKSGWHIVAWCEEPVTTARFEDIEHRPQFARLLESVERGEVDVVLCACNDRWTRNELVAYASIAIMYNAGVWWETTDQRWDINKTREHGSDMLFALDNAQNAGYSRRLSKKQSSAKRQGQGKACIMETWDMDICHPSILNLPTMPLPTGVLHRCQRYLTHRRGLPFN